MNLWIFNHYAITPDMPGGIRHYDLARELLNRGHDVTIFASSFHHNLHKEMKLLRSERWKVDKLGGIKFVWFKTFPYQKNNWRRVLNMLSYMVQSYRLGGKITRLNQEVSKPDVIIGSTVHLLAVLAAYWVAKHHKARFIMEVRDLWPQTIIEMGRLSKRHPITRTLQVLERFLYRRAERIIVLGPQMREYIAARGVSEERIVWIPNGVDLSRFEGVEVAESPSEGFKVMYLGAHGQNDDLDLLLLSTKLLQDRGYQDVKFILFGDGPEKPRLIKLAKKLNLKNVEFRDPVPKSQVPKVIQEVDAAVLILKGLPLYKYGISANKLFDYLAARKPLILAGNPVNNPVEEAQCGLTVPPQDPQALAEAIIQLYHMSPEERKAMGRRGREYVERHHDITKLAGRLEHVLSEAVRGG